MKVSKPVSERAGCYAAKSTLDDAYWMIMCETCSGCARQKLRSVANVGARCQCEACRIILHARQRCMFIGPAMRLLLVALRQPAEGARADLERRAMDICAKLLADLNMFFFKYPGLVLCAVHSLHLGEISRIWHSLARSCCGRRAQITPRP